MRNSRQIAVAVVVVVVVAVVVVVVVVVVSGQQWQWGGDVTWQAVIWARTGGTHSAAAQLRLIVLGRGWLGWGVQQEQDTAQCSSYTETLHCEASGGGASCCCSAQLSLVSSLGGVSNLLTFFYDSISFKSIQKRVIPENRTLTISMRRDCNIEAEHNLSADSRAGQARHSSGRLPPVKIWMERLCAATGIMHLVWRMCVMWCVQISAAPVRSSLQIEQSDDERQQCVVCYCHVWRVTWLSRDTAPAAWHRHLVITSHREMSFIYFYLIILITRVRTVTPQSSPM